MLFASSLKRASLAALLGLATLAVHAQQKPAEEIEDPLDKSWKEVALQLPAAPQPQNLVEFYVSPTATQKFAIDSKSLAVGKDGVVRYTLVSWSPSGAKNISYEGIRCEVLQLRIYAFGQADGSWRTNRHDDWEAIQPASRNRQHAALASEFLCADRVVAGKAEAIVTRMQRQGGVNALKDPVTTPGIYAN